MSKSAPQVEWYIAQDDAAWAALTRLPSPASTSCGAPAGPGLLDAQRWPIAQGVLPPEARATGRRVLDMGINAVAALALTLSGWLINGFGGNVCDQAACCMRVCHAVTIWAKAARSSGVR